MTWLRDDHPWSARRSTRLFAGADSRRDRNRRIGNALREHGYSLGDIARALRLHAATVGEAKSKA